MKQQFKICGVTSIEDAKMISTFPVNFIGLNFVQRSKRKISGGLYKNFRKKRLTDLARDSTLTKIANLNRKKLRKFIKNRI